jgi:hypothetical protein
MLRISAIVVAFSLILECSAALAGDCVLRDSQNAYSFSDEAPITIIGNKCTTRVEAENEVNSATIITCEGLNPIAITMHQGELYSYDMVTSREERLIGECAPE